MMTAKGAHDLLLGYPAFRVDGVWKCPFPERCSDSWIEPRFSGYLIQFSTRSPRTRENSPVLSVTRIAPAAQA